MSSIAALSRSYQPLTPGQEREQLLSFGLDEGTAGFMVALNADLRDGAMAPPPAASPTSSAPHRTAGRHHEDMDRTSRQSRATH